jgi:Cu/Ag efflux pump CusA
MALKSFITLFDWSLNHRLILVACVAGFFVFSASLSTRLGSEFIPSLDEGDVALHALRIPGTSLTRQSKCNMHLNEKLKDTRGETILPKLVQPKLQQILCHLMWQITMSC